MEENISKTLSYVFAVLFFITALTLFFTLYRDSRNTVGRVHHALTGKGVVYQTEYWEDSGYMSGVEVLGLIKNSSDTKIRMENVWIATQADRETFDYSLIDMPALYLVEYIFNDSGGIAYVSCQKR